MKNEALREKAFIQQKLNSKSEVVLSYIQLGKLSSCTIHLNEICFSFLDAIVQELTISNSECSRLEQRNMALAKELAVLKL